MRRQLTDTNTKMNQMSELSDNDFKATKIKMIQQIITNYLKTNEKNRKFQERDRGHKTSKMEIT